MKKFLSLAMALVMTFSLVTISAGAKDFTDKSSIAYKEAVDVVSAIGIVDGYTDGSFNPSATLTRGAAAKIICNLILGPTTASALSADSAPYSDVPANSTFAGYIAYCQKAGIISGYSDGTFRPAGTLTGYAFMKMLLGALGYDSEIEGYTGANWSVNVAKQAIAIGLDAGNDGFSGTKAVTREEAALYAFNTLQADLVEYDAKTTATVNGVTVTVGGNVAKAMTWKNSATADGNIEADGYIQFAEQYFNKLVKTYTTDDFAQPATKWTNKGLKIGSYNDDPSVSYTSNVKTGDIYADLNMNQKDESAEVYVNGEKATSVNISKNNQAKLATVGGANDGLVGDGSIVNVYYDEDTNEVKICVIDVFVGEVTSVDKKAATPFINVVPEGAVKNIAGAAVAVAPKFETSENFSEDDIVLFTYSVSAGAIKSVKVAESVEGTVEKYTTGKNLTLDETTYKYSKNIEFANGMTTKNDYVVYLDENGLAIFVDEKEFNASDYAFVLAAESSNQQGFKTDRAKLLTSDAKLLVVTTDDDYTSLINQIVTYRKDSNGEYVLRAAANQGANGTIASVTDLNSNGTTDDEIATDGLLKDGAADFDMKNTNAIVTMTSGVTKYSNSETVFVVMTYDSTNNKVVYDSYTGIKNAPSITLGGIAKTEAAWTMRGNVLGIVFIDAIGSDITVSNATKDVLFLSSKNGTSKLIVDSDNNQYYEYKAVNGDGEITTVKVSATATGLVPGATTDAYNEAYTNVKTNNKGIITAVSAANYGGTYTEIDGDGIWKLSGTYTIGLNATKDRYTVASDAKIYRIDTNGDITKLDSVDDIYSDVAAKVKVLFNTSDGDLDYIFIQEVNTNPNNGGVNNVPGVVTALSYNRASGDVSVTASKAGTYTVKVEVLSSGTYVSAATYSVVIAADGGTNTVNIGILDAGNARITCGTKTALS